VIRRHRDFAPTPESVGAARGFVSAVLSELATTGLHPLAPSARLVVSELASNAVQHAHTPFAVEVCCDPGVVISVEDASPAPPELRDQSPNALRGRGLFLVDKMCERWGFERTDKGKRVWGRLSATGPALGTPP